MERLFRIRLGWYSLPFMTRRVSASRTRELKAVFTMFRNLAVLRIVFTGLATASLLMTQTPIADAHPGHGSPTVQDGVLHYVASPLHAGPVLIVAGIVAVGVWLAVRFQQSKSDD